MRDVSRGIRQDMDRLRSSCPGAYARRRKSRYHLGIPYDRSIVDVAGVWVLVVVNPIYSLNVCHVGAS